MADGEPIWVCAVCHSVDKIGAKQGAGLLLVVIGAGLSAVWFGRLP